MKPAIIYETLWNMGYSPYQMVSRISSINSISHYQLVFRQMGSFVRTNCYSNTFGYKQTPPLKTSRNNPGRSSRRCVSLMGVDSAHGGFLVMGVRTALLEVCKIGNKIRTKRTMKNRTHKPPRGKQKAKLPRWCVHHTVQSSGTLPP